MVTMIILPDTNIFIYVFSGQKPYDVKFKEWVLNDKIIVSVIVVAEFLVKSDPTDSKLFLDVCDRFAVVDVDLEIARIAANIRRTSLSRKQKLNLSDCLIAAQCQIYGATLATNNPGDYPPATPKYSF